MPVTIVVGGQYGSEGKGKVAHHLHEANDTAGFVRVGGSNSGHTVVTADGSTHILRQLPVAAILPDSNLFLPPGNYLDLDVLLTEMRTYKITPARLAIDPNASIVTDQDRDEERRQGLTGRIGSTGSGTGAAVSRRIARDGGQRASDIPELERFVRPTGPAMRALLDGQHRILIEGTQGFGLSLLHGGHRDYATSRDTTAAGFLSEAGLSPLDVDEIVMVLRALPIRVAGNSGPLPKETDWEQVARQAGRPGLHERTTVTHKTRRVAHFDADVVQRAITSNHPSTIVLNHVDYLADLSTDEGLDAARRAVECIEEAISRRVDLIGTDPMTLAPRQAWGTSTRPAPRLPVVPLRARPVSTMTRQ